MRRASANRWAHKMSVRVYYIVFLSLIYFDESSDVRCFAVTFKSLRKRYVTSPEKKFLLLMTVRGNKLKFCYFLMLLPKRELDKNTIFNHLTYCK